MRLGSNPGARKQRCRCSEVNDVQCYYRLKMETLEVRGHLVLLYFGEG